MHAQNDATTSAPDTSSPIEVVLRYHALTQSVPAFAELLIAAIQYCFTSKILSNVPQRDIYRRLASGPLVSTDFGAHFEKALHGTFVGGISEERGWGKVVSLFGTALQESSSRLKTEGAKQSDQSPAEAPSKRRRKNDGSSTAVISNTGLLPAGAGPFGIVSRLLAAVLYTAYGKGQGYEKYGRAEDVLRIVDSVASAWRENADSASDEEVAAGILRLRKAEELLRREVILGRACIRAGHGEAVFEQVRSSNWRTLARRLIPENCRLIINSRHGIFPVRRIIRRYQALSTVWHCLKLRCLGLEKSSMSQEARVLLLYGTSWLSEA